MKRLTLSIFLILALLTACTARSLGVKDAWARPGNSGGNSAIYFVVENPTNQADKLLSASSNAADTVEVHMSKMVEEGMMMMEPQESVEIPAGKNISFEPGGLHIMLVGLKNDLKVGDSLKVTLKFENAGELTVEAQVREP